MEDQNGCDMNVKKQIEQKIAEAIGNLTLIGATKLLESIDDVLSYITTKVENVIDNVVDLVDGDQSEKQEVAKEETPKE